MADTGKLGTPDSRLGNLELAYVSAGVVRPLAGTRIGRLGTPASMLGNVMLDIGVEEGSGITVYEVSATNTLSLSSEAVVTNSSRGVSAANTLVLSSVAVLTNIARSLGASNTLNLSQLVGLGFSKAVSAANTLSLSSTAALFPWTSTLVSAESTLDLSVEATGRHAHFRPTATSTLSLTQLANTVAFTIYDVSASSTLSLTTESTGRHSSFRSEGESVLSLSSEAQGRHSHFRPTSISTLSLGSIATGRHASFRPVGESILSLTQDASTTLSHTITVSAESYLWLFGYSTGRHSHFRPVAASTLTLTGAVGLTKTVNVGAVSYLQTTEYVYDPETDEMVTTIEGLQNSAYCGKSSVYHAHSIIPLIQRATGYVVASDAIMVSAENTISLSDQARKNVVGDAITQISFTQGAIATRSNPTVSQITVTNVASVSVVRKRIASSTLVLKQAVSYSLLRSDVSYQYRPFVGAGESSSPTPPPTTLSPPLAGVTDPFKLLYPATGTITDFLVIRAPNLGNKDKLVFNRISRETRGGTLVVFADPIWPKIQTLSLTFSGLTLTEADALLAFVDAHLGQEIGLLDWEHRYWKGVIMTPEDPIVQDTRDTYSASFEFEGELDPTWTP